MSEKGLSIYLIYFQAYDLFIEFTLESNLKISKDIKRKRAERQLACCVSCQ